MNSKSYPDRMPLRWIVMPVLALAAVAATLIGLALYFHRVGVTPYYGTPFFGWWFGLPFFGFGWIIIPLVFIIIFFGFRWFLWGAWGWGHGWGYCGRYYDPALQTLRERYARGEITKEQFEDMRRKLHESK